MKNKEKLYKNISTICFMLTLVCGLIFLVCSAIIPLINCFIYFIENTTFSIQELIAIFSCIGSVTFAIVGLIFACLNWHWREREEEKRLEHEFRMQFEGKNEILDIEIENINDK